ncbi:hybrid sensor histidine kinase/response regulator [Candidatus Magnetomonas plexicatena]|uniref:hybrid sensor histidine kinase/response regulator n=1 Tax=Candidatus Magnetomonas plexicatena TaxID=2552947 RepID=UPI0011055780|nr:PAS domain S-box protein [Nitrospirales bacterium LBB_01]
MEDNTDKIKVLLIEDDTSDADYISELLSEITCINFIIENVQSLTEAKKYLSLAFDTNVILLDLNLPGSYGFDTFLHLKKLTPNIPILILTGLEDEELANRAVLEGAMNYLVKSELKSRALARSIYHAVEHHKLTQRIKQSNELRFYQIIKQNADGILIIDMDGRVRFVNPAAEKLFGKKSDELVGEYFGFPVVSSNKTEIEILHKNGRSASIEMKVVEMEWEDEIVLLASLRDITQRKRLLAKISDLNKNLEQKVIEEVEKRRIQENLLIQKSKMATMGEMINSIAHQWKQPLHSLSLIIQDIKEAYIFKQMDEKYIDDTIDSAMKQIIFMSDTVTDFRDFFKPTKVKVQIDINIVINSVLAIVASELMHLKITINHKCKCMIHDLSSENCTSIKTCAYNLLNVLVYPNEIKQVLLNIIVNAKDAITSARLKGMLKDNENGVIQITSLNDKEGIKVIIEDNAGGIPESLLNKIFEPYFSTKGDEGTGIGLYMSKIIIEHNMGGKLYVNNTDKGAAFTIEIPNESV